MEWMLARDWFHSASRLDAGDARHVLIFQKKLYDDPTPIREPTAIGPWLGADRLIRDTMPSPCRPLSQQRSSAW